MRAITLTAVASLALAGCEDAGLLDFGEEFVDGGGTELRQDPRPAEEPPADYAEDFYIDSRGCYFFRAGRETGNISWVPRVNRARELFCDPSAARPRVAVAAVEPETIITAEVETEVAPETGPAEAGSTGEGLLSRVRNALGVGATTAAVAAETASPTTAAVSDFEVLPSPQDESNQARMMAEAEAEALAALEAEEAAAEQRALLDRQADETRSANPGTDTAAWLRAQLLGGAGAPQDEPEIVAAVEPEPELPPAPAPQIEVAAIAPAPVPVVPEVVEPEPAPEPVVLAPIAQPEVAAALTPEPTAPVATAVPATVAATFAAPPPVKPPRLVTSVRYNFVHAGNFPVNANAEAARFKLEGLGLPAQVRRVDMGGETTNSVVVGPIDSDTRLSAAMTEVRKAGFLGAYFLISR